MSEKQDTGWTTENELNFIAKGVINRRNKSHAKRFIDGYLIGAIQRTRWGDIDAAKVIDFAQKRRKELDLL